MSESKKKDWAAISDDEDEESEEETSPVREPEQEEAQGTGPAVEEEPEEVYEEKAEVSQTEDQKKTEMISQINNANLPKVHLNVFNVRPEITEQDVLDFYQPLKIDRIFKTNTKNPNLIMYDLEFSNKDDAIKIIEKGSGTIKNCKFQIRVSLRTLRPDNFNKPRGDKGGRNYGSNETRPYNKDRNYGGERRDYQGYGGDKGGYGDRNKGYYDKPYEKRGEGRRDDRGPRKEGGGYRENKYGGKNEGYQAPVKDQPVKKEEDNKEPELPKEWQKAWEQREEEVLPKEWQKAWEKRDEGGDRYEKRQQGGRDNKYQGKGDSYNRGGKTEENKSDIQMKGRGQTKYGKEDNLEQDKIMQGGYQDSYKKPYRRDREEGEGGRKQYSNYNDKWSKEAPKMNSKQGSRNFEEKQYYVKKNQSEGKDSSSPSEKLGDPTLTKRPSALKSQNTVNPFDLLPQ